MRPEGLDPVHVRRLRKMSPEERLKAAFGLNELTERLADAGARARREASDDSDVAGAEA